MGEGGGGEGNRNGRHSLIQVLTSDGDRLERYERRALAKRRRALRGEGEGERGGLKLGGQDAAGGTGTDSFVLAIAHREHDEAKNVVLDVIREYKPRFVPALVIGELVRLLKFYNNVKEVYGDKFGGGFHSSEWQRHGITFKPCENTTSQNYLTLLPMLLSGRARLRNNQVHDSSSPALSVAFTPAIASPSIIRRSPARTMMSVALRPGRWSLLPRNRHIIHGEAGSMSI